MSIRFSFIFETRVSKVCFVVMEGICPFSCSFGQSSLQSSILARFWSKNWIVSSFSHRSSLPTSLHWAPPCSLHWSLLLQPRISPSALPQSSPNVIFCIRLTDRRPEKTFKFVTIILFCSQMFGSICTFPRRSFPGRRVGFNCLWWELVGKTFSKIFSPLMTSVRRFASDCTERQACNQLQRRGSRGTGIPRTSSFSSTCMHEPKNPDASKWICRAFLESHNQFSISN